MKLQRNVILLGLIFTNNIFNTNNSFWVPGKLKWIAAELVTAVFLRCGILWTLSEDMVEPSCIPIRFLVDANSTIITHINHVLGTWARVSHWKCVPLLFLNLLHFVVPLFTSYISFSLHKICCQDCFSRIQNFHKVSANFRRIEWPRALLQFPELSLNSLVPLLVLSLLFYSL